MDDSHRNPKRIKTGLPIDPSPLDSVSLFPLEIQEMIISSLYPQDGEWADTATLKSCALVCRNWHRVVPKVLYTRVQVFGRKNYKLLEMNLKKDPSIRRHLHTLCIHDVTPGERASFGALHTLPRITHLRIKQLFIFGALIPLPVKIRGPTVTFPDGQGGPKHCQFLVPYEITLLANLPRFTSLQHIHLYQIRMKSLDGLRKILGTLPNLNSAEFRDVWWGDADAGFRPLHNATSWQLSQFSLSNCAQNFAAPFFWALPPDSGSNQTTRRMHEDGRTCHPGICAADVDPLVRLADFVLRRHSSYMELARSFCWEWELEENGTNQWCLKCCVDKVENEEDEFGDESTPSFLYFHFLPTMPITPELNRIVEIRILFESKSQDEYDMKNMESILCEFKELRRLNLDNLDMMRKESARFDLPDLRKELEHRGVLNTPEEPPVIVRRHWDDRFHDEEDEEEDEEGEEEEGNIRPRLCRVEENGDWINPGLCCVRIRHLIADSRPLLLSSLVRLMGKLLNQRLEKEAERAREGLLQVQRELALLDEVKFVPLVNKTLHSMFEQVQTQMKDDPTLRDDGEPFYSVNVGHLWSRLTRTRATSCHNNPLYIFHLLATLTGAASSHHKLGDQETAIKFSLQVVDVCAHYANGFSLENPKGILSHTQILGPDIQSTYVPFLANAIRYLAVHSPQQLLPLSKQGNSRTRLWDAWAEVARQDDTYTPRLEEVLKCHFNVFGSLGKGLLRSFDVPDSQFSTLIIILYQKTTVDVWRGLAERYPMVYAPRLAEVLKEIVSDHRPRDIDFNGGPVADRDHRRFIDHRREMMGLWRWVVKQDVIKYAPSLADALELSALDCIQMRQPNEAISFRREAVGVWRELVQQDTTSYGLSLENSLHHLALDLFRLQESIDSNGNSSRHEAVAIWRELTERNPSAYAGDLARSSYEMGSSCSQLGRHDQALAFYFEAIRAWRSQENVGPTTFDDLYPRCLNSMSWSLIYLKRELEAVPLIHECVDRFRALGQSKELFKSLDTKSVILAKTKDFGLAITASHESVQGFRSLIDLDPHRRHRYYPRLAVALRNLSVPLISLGWHDQALGAVEEALIIYRTLNSHEPSKYDQMLARTLRRYTYILKRVGRFEDARAIDKASDIRKVLVSVDGVTDSNLDPETQVSKAECANLPVDLCS